MRRKYARFWWFFAVGLVLLSAISGFAQAFQFGYGLQKFGGMLYAPRALALGTVRELASGPVLAAGLLAWIALCHEVEPALARQHFAAIATRVAAAGPLAFPVAVTFTLLAGLVTSRAFGLSAGEFVSSAVRTIVIEDLLVGLLSSLVASALTIFIAWLVVPRLSGTKWS